MFKLYFDYQDKKLSFTDCFAFGISPKGRNLYVKYKKDGRLITQSFYTKFVENFMFSF